MADDWFYDGIERSRLLYDTNPSYAGVDLIKKFRRWYDLIVETEESLKSKPSSSRNLRVRKRRKCEKYVGENGPRSASHLYPCHDNDAFH